jgi:hypothetical protein
MTDTSNTLESLQTKGIVMTFEHCYFHESLEIENSGIPYSGPKIEGERILSLKTEIAPFLEVRIEWRNRLFRPPRPVRAKTRDETV